MEDSESEWLARRRNQENKKYNVKLLVALVLVRVAEKAKMHYTLFALDNISQHLLDKIWTEVKNMEFEMSQKVFHEYKEQLCAQLVEDFGSAHMALQLVTSENSADIELITGYFTCALKLLEQPGEFKTSIKRFLDRNWKILLLTTVTISVAAWKFRVIDRFLPPLPNFSFFV